MGSLTGKASVLTGASRAVTAGLFVAAGCRVVAADRDAVAAQVADPAASARVAHTDVTPVALAAVPAPGRRMAAGG